MRQLLQLFVRVVNAGFILMLMTGWAETMAEYTVVNRVYKTRAPNDDRFIRRPVVCGKIFCILMRCGAAGHVRRMVPFVPGRQYG